MQLCFAHLASRVCTDFNHLGASRKLKDFLLSIQNLLDVTCTAPVGFHLIVHGRHLTFLFFDDFSIFYPRLPHLLSNIPLQHHSTQLLWHVTHQKTNKISSNLSKFSKKNSEKNQNKNSPKLGQLKNGTAKNIFLLWTFLKNYLILCSQK